VGAWYVDTSAAAKLVIEEEHSAALRAWALERSDDLVGSDLVRTELLRATRRYDPDLVGHAQGVLDALALVALPPDLFRAAALIEPPGLGTLDALHLACALDMGDDLDGLVTYDARMAVAARRLALEVVSPA
jgi:predicted nucleic acid-binding protein